MEKQLEEHNSLLARSLSLSLSLSLSIALIMMPLNSPPSRLPDRNTKKDPSQKKQEESPIIQNPLPKHAFRSFFRSDAQSIHFFDEENLFKTYEVVNQSTKPKRKTILKPAGPRPRPGNGPPQCDTDSWERARPGS
jgi:hypothetical protein